jgi:hypothetical protein
MKTLALILFVGSFLAGAFLTSLDPETVAWSYMVPVLALGLVALWIHRKAEHSEIRSGERLAGNIQVLASSLDNIRRNLEAVVARGDDLPVYEARFEIDRLFREDLDRFAEARESMIHVFGMQHYADVMSNFAAGERYINRVWSASTDGYVDEVRQYLERARTQFREAQEHFDELAAQFSTQVTDH